MTTVVPRAARRFWPTLESVLVADFERSGGLLGLMGATGAASSSSSSYGPFFRHPALLSFGVGPLYLQKSALAGEKMKSPFS